MEPSALDDTRQGMEPKQAEGGYASAFVFGGLVRHQESEWYG
jgi:hypothetical protein